MRIGTSGICLTAGLLVLGAIAPASARSLQSAGPSNGDGGPLFRRVSTFPVFLNTSADVETAAEIVAATEDGRLLVYTDSPTGNLGFVDISDPADPQPAGVVALGGEPTSVAVKGRLALVCVNTSPNFVETSGDLVVVDMATRQIVRTLPLGGQPDAIAISPDGRYGAVCIENERDEDLGNGEPPQAPPGFVVILDLVGPPELWSTRVVDLVGVPTLYPEDPEPEFVDINDANIAVVTLQENNELVLINLVTGTILHHFPAGTVDLTEIDTDENDLIEQSSSLRGIAREPDAVAWISTRDFATADEGDLFGGSRGFTTWSFTGSTLYQAGNTLEHHVARLGHYPESRSENKGNEPEGVEFGVYGRQSFLFVGSERACVVLVYQLFPGPVFGSTFPVLRQTLPAGVGPEGLLAIPARNLFVVASEGDSRGDKYRSSIMIYELSDAPSYPDIVSDDLPGTTRPIPWAALSGLVTDPASDGTLYTIHDSYYRESRIYTLDRTSSPARITDELVLNDASGVLLSALQALKASLPGTDDFDPASLVNADLTVNLDPEGIEVAPDGSFLLASEGAGNLVDGVSDPANRPFESPNLILRVDASTGTILDAVLLPLELVRDQLRFGFEGVAYADGAYYVAFQRAWQASGDPSDRARIGRYDLANGEWTFAYYPLDAPTSPNGGWVGLSELTSLGAGEFAVLERDDQGGTDARVKRVYTISTLGVDFRPDSQAPALEVLSKSLAIDLIAADVYGPTGGPVPEKLEGLAVLSDGTTLIVNDNDGVEDNSGETRLIVIPALF